MAPTRVAIIGGGVSGAVCASTLCPRSEAEVTVFDQGRQLGGRSAHRRVATDGSYPAPEDSAVFAFDHGCQFFRADDPRFRAELLEDWLTRGLVKEWNGNFGKLGEAADFFGFPDKPPFYCAEGGMSSLPTALLQEAEKHGARLRGGVRVASTQRLRSGSWLLRGVEGPAALHDTAEEEAAKHAPDALGEFDVVIVTDVSASMASWHRASAGLPESIASKVRNRTRVVLFTALVAFEAPLSVEAVAFAAASPILWFAARTSSKPGLAEFKAFDCWTLVSTPKYAAEEIERVPMQDPETGAFRPQEPGYIRDGPSAVLIAEFQRLLGLEELPSAAYVGGQRWGSAFPAPGAGRTDSTVDVMNVAYEGSVSLELVPSSPAPVQGFLAEDDDGLYYVGDFVSGHTPGLEAAALSGYDCSLHLQQRLAETSGG